MTSSKPPSRQRELQNAGRLLEKGEPAK